MYILNLTQHPATPEQIALGVRDVHPALQDDLRALLTFDDVPSPDVILRRAKVIAEFALLNGLGPEDGDDPRPEAAMIGGAPYLMAALERALMAVGVEPVYAFTRRETVETVGADGAVTKTSVFRHAGWVRPWRQPGE